MKFCYTLASDGCTDYCDITSLSVALLRSLHLECTISLVTDAPSIRANTKHLLFDQADELIIAETMPGNAVLRSRDLKTSLRQLVSGAFVFLDADALPVAPLNCLFYANADFAASPNRDGKCCGAHFPKSLIPDFETCGWTWPTRAYVNSGVMYWSESEKAYSLAELYRRNWEAWVANTGRHHDQPALNAAITDCDSHVKILAMKYNAPIDVATEFGVGASILHFYKSVYQDDESELQWHDLLLAKFLSENRIDWNIIRNIVEGRYKNLASDEVNRLVASALRVGDNEVAFHLIKILASKHFLSRSFARSILAAVVHAISLKPSGIQAV